MENDNIFEGCELLENNLQINEHRYNKIFMFFKNITSAYSGLATCFLICIMAIGIIYIFLLFLYVHFGSLYYSFHLDSKFYIY